MAYIRLDDRFPDHPKIARAGPEAAYLYVCGLCYCNRYLTDGFIPAAVVPRLVPYTPEQIQQTVSTLLDACLWHVSSKSTANAGYDVHGYLEYQSSRASVMDVRTARQAAGKAGGLAPHKLRSKNSKRQAKVQHKEEVRREEEKKEVIGEPTAQPPGKRVTVVDEPFIARMIAKHSPQWTPAQVRERIEEALAHKSRSKWTDIQLYVQGWLRRDAERSNLASAMPQIPQVKDLQPHPGRKLLS